MGAILPGPGTPVGGSVGSLTYSRNRYGAYVRNRTKPVNPNSAAQNAYRSNFRAAVAAWQDLTYAQRSAWDAWAAATPWLNAAGESISLTGQAAWIRRFMSAFDSANLPAGDQLLPPVENDVGSINIDVGYPTDGAYPVEFDFATQTMDLATLPTSCLSAPVLSNSSAVSNGRFTIQVTPPQNPTRWFPGSRWLQADNGNRSYAWSAGPPVAVDYLGILNNGFTYQVGHRLWLRIRGIGVLGSTAAERRTTTQQIVGPFDLIAPTP